MHNLINWAMSVWYGANRRYEDDARAWREVYELVVAVAAILVAVAAIILSVRGAK